MTGNSSQRRSLERRIPRAQREIAQDANDKPKEPAARSKTRKKNEAERKPLDRTSYESIAGIGVAIGSLLLPQTWMLSALLWAVLAGLMIEICLFSRVTIRFSLGHKIGLCVLSTSLIVALAYHPVVARYRVEQEIPPSPDYLKVWGNSSNFVIKGWPPKVVSGEAQTVMIVNGVPLEKYKSRYKLMGIVFHQIQGESYLDKAQLCKSRIYSIRPEEISIAVKYNEKYLEEMQDGASMEGYVLLAVPIGMNSEEFQTLSSAEDMGAKIIARVASSRPLIRE